MQCHYFSSRRNRPLAGRFSEKASTACNHLQRLVHVKSSHEELDQNHQNQIPTAYQTPWHGADSHGTSFQTVTIGDRAVDGSESSTISWTFDGSSEQADVQALHQIEKRRLQQRRAWADQLPPTPTVITQLPRHLDKSTLMNALLLIDKPKDWDVEEVLRSIRWSLKIKSLSCIGALEPLATGLMLVCLGSASKLTNAMNELPKSYSGIIRLGEATDTYDASGNITQQMDWEHVTDEAIFATSQNFKGEVFQLPPKWSTVKTGGRKFLNPNQTGSQQLRAQPVYISQFDASREAGRDIQFSITLGQSGFVRSIAHDFGLSLGTCSHLIELRRESIGPFSVSNAWALDVLIPLLKRYRR